MKKFSNYEIFGNVLNRDAFEALARKVFEELHRDDFQREILDADTIHDFLQRLDCARYPEDVAAEVADEDTPVYNSELLGKTWDLYRYGWMDEAQEVCEKNEDIIRLHAVAWYLALERAYSEAVRLAEEYAPDFVTLYVVRARESGDVVDTFETFEEAREALKEYEAEDEYEIVETTPGLLE